MRGMVVGEGGRSSGLLLYIISSRIMYTCQNKDFRPSFPQRFAPGIDADKVLKR